MEMLLGVQGVGGFFDRRAKTLAFFKIERRAASGDQKLQFDSYWKIASGYN